MNAKLIILLAVLCHKSTFANFVTVLRGTVIIGGPCEVSGDCVGVADVSSKCDGLSKKCVCMDGYIVQRDLMDCLAIRHDVGEQCTQSEQCQKGQLQTLSDCVDAKCQCKETAVKAPTIPECLLKANLVGDSCQSTYQCEPNLGEAICNGKDVCECQDSIPRSDNTKCIPLVEVIGGVCEETPQCKEGAPGDYSECRNLICECVEGAVRPEFGETCLPEAELGDVCSDNEQCWTTLGHLSICDGVCKCRQGQAVPSGDRSTCLPIVEVIGGGCNETVQCKEGAPGDYSECRNMTCECVEGAVRPEFGETCLPEAGLGDVCSDNVQCWATLGELSICDGVCKCRQEAVPSGDQTTCLLIVEVIGGGCNETVQCKEGAPGDYSECRELTCECVEGAVRPEFGETCLPELGFGDVCSDNEQCRSLGDLGGCDGICKCKDGQAVPNADRTTCLPVATEIGEMCEVDEQCLQGMPGRYSSCLEGHCRCTDEAVQVIETQVCQRKAEFVEEFCRFHEQCRANLGELSECMLGFCVCSENTVISVDRRKCLRGPVLIGEPCEDDNQCIANSQCSGTGHCGCLEDFVPNSSFDRCLPVLEEIGGICEERVQCQHGTPGNLSDCIVQNFTGTPVKVCNCTQDAVARPEWNKCYKKANFVGDSCEILEQCSVPLGLSLCSGDVCICSRDANPSSDRSKCLLKAGYGLPCEDDGQCSHISEPNSTRCHQTDPESDVKICQCNPGYVEREEGNGCVKLATSFGDPCISNLQCQNLVGSMCRNVNGSRGCHCDYSKEVVNGQGNRCLPLIPNLNDGLCEETIQCLGSNAECLAVNTSVPNKQCRCRQNTFVESTLRPGNCLQIVRQFNQQCEEDIQCTTGIDTLTECRDLKCDCKARYIHYNGHCYFPAPLGGFCGQDEECYVGVNNLTVCPSHGKCECLSTAVEWQGVCWEDKRIGDPCETDAQCRVTILGDVMCNQRICSCPLGQVGEMDNRWCTAGGGNPWLSGSLLILSMLIVLYFNK